MAFGSLSVKGRALRHLAQRDHSRAELVRKLARKVEDQAGTDGAEAVSASQQIETALDELTAHGLLCEERAAASLLHSQSQRFGERRLKQTMQMRGFAPDLVASTLAQARGGELERAREIWRRKFRTPAQDAAQRGKQMRFLMGRGFSGEVASRVLREGSTALDDDCCYDCCYDSGNDSGNDSEDKRGGTA